MKSKLILAAFALTMSAGSWAKLPAPPPVPPEKAAADAEAKAKADAAVKAQLAAAEDRVAARYIKEQKAKGKDVKPQMSAAAPAPKSAQPAKK